MAERLEPSFEKSEKLEAAPKAETAETAKSVEKQPAPEKTTEINQIEQKAKQEAKSSKDTVVEKQAESNDNYHLATAELKSEALKRSLRKTRKQLPAFDRTLSKFIHAPGVDSASKVVGNTVVRPRGVLLGALVALGGSGYLLYSAKHYGYSYNYLVVFLLFVAGYVVGLVLDLLLAIFKRSK